MNASERYRLKVLPAGRNDRVVEIADREGNVLKYIYCSHRLGTEAGGLDAVIRQDFETMDAFVFAAKYDIPEPPAGHAATTPEPER